jgi:excisionase family DNA binding protein
MFEIDELRSEIERLQVERRAMQDDLANAQAENEQLWSVVRENESLQTELAQARTEIDRQTEAFGNRRGLTQEALGQARQKKSWLSSWLTTRQAAAELGLSPSRIRQFHLDGRLPATKRGRDLLFHMRDVQKMRGRMRPNGRPPRAVAYVRN